MYLKSLEIIGFKSFAKKTNIGFTTPVTAIVGPNGSGKSNVAEAFRFVLGEQSVKSMRGKKGEDLIWNGGKDIPRLNRASVKATFDNTTRLFSKCDFDEVTIERVINRDGNNEYLLNNTEVRLKDINEILAEAHVGTTGHHIISQGEADSVLSCSNMERREIIEDALGLKIYEWKKTESEKKLQKTLDNMQQIDGLRKELSPHIRFLKKQVEKIEKSREDRGTLLNLYREYFAKEKSYLDFEKNRLGELLSTPKKDLSNIEREIENLRNTLDLDNTQNKDEDKLLEIGNKIAEIRQKKDVLTRETGRLDGAIYSLNKTIEREKLKNSANEDKIIYVRDVETLVIQIESLHSINDVKVLFNEVINNLKTFITRFKSKIDTSIIDEYTKELENLKRDKSKIDDELSKIDMELSRSNLEYEEMRNVLMREKNKKSEAEKNLIIAVTKQNELRMHIQSINQELMRLENDEDVFKKAKDEAHILLGRDAVSFEDMVYVKELRSIQHDRMKQIERLKYKIEESSFGNADEIIKEYKETSERDTHLEREISDLIKAEDELRNIISDLNKRIDKEFRDGIEKINSEFDRLFRIMFGGGYAKLNVVRMPEKKKKIVEDDIEPQIFDVKEEEDDIREGLEVDVSLPTKKVKGLMMLSGGERALTSIALLFAISRVNPPPFIILDETDAALDESNSRKYGDMIESLSQQSELIIITHNRETMSRAGALYGVTMNADGASRLLSIIFDEAVRVAK